MTRLVSKGGGAPRILVVDDTPANLKLLHEILTNHGYRVRPATSGRLALRSIAAETPDLILLDVLMPEMDGYEVCHRLKADETSRGIPVIFISALDSISDKLKGFEAGGIDYVTKPFQEAEVLARVETHLSLRRLQKVLEEQNVRLQEEIEAREQFEAELKSYQEHLEEVIAERTTELRDSEIRYRTLFESANDAIILIRFEHVVSCNQKTLELFRCSGDELAHQSLLTLSPQLQPSGVPSGGELRERLLLALSGVPQFFEWQHRRPSGELFEVETSLNRLDFHGDPFLQAIMRDITGRKAAQQARLENARIRRELEIAQEIQQSFLPRHPPVVAGVLTAFRCEPAANVGGDYYDFFRPDDNLLDVVIADVAGHSIGSALLMTVTRSVLHARAGREYPPGRLLAEVNNLLYDDLSRAELLNSMFYARLDLSHRTLAYANAGHTRSQLYKARDGSFQELDAEGLLMGVRRDVFFEEKRVTVETGDILVLHTDGVSESESAAGVPFGTGRLRTIIGRHRDAHPDDIMNAVFGELAEFRRGSPHEDDMTMVIIKVA